MLRLIRSVALAAILLLAGLWGAAWLLRSPGEDLAASLLRQLAAFTGADMPVPSAGGVQLPQGIALGGPFNLLDHTGQQVTERSYGERWRLIFFGFVFCPDVCPTELGRVADVLDLLGPEAARVVPIFVSIDPERDTPAVMADYVSRFHPAMVGLTGTPEQVAAAARAFRVYYAKVRPPNASDYLMDHSAFLYLVAPDGRVRALFRPDTGPEAIAAAIRGQWRGN